MSMCTQGVHPPESQCDTGTCSLSARTLGTGQSRRRRESHLRLGTHASAPIPQSWLSAPVAWAGRTMVRTHGTVADR